MIGVCSDRQIRTMIADGTIRADPAILDAQVQPASLDLRLGGAWMDRFLARAPFLRSEAESHFNLTGEVAVSAKNPNKRRPACKR